MTQFDDDDDDIINDTDTEDDAVAPAVAAANTDSDDDDIVDDAADSADSATSAATVDNEIRYPEDRIDFRGEDPAYLADRVRECENVIGAVEIDKLTRDVGSWQNLMFRSLLDRSEEEERIQAAITVLAEEDKQALTASLLDPDSHKKILGIRSMRTSNKNGVSRVVSGEDAMAAFEGQNSGGTFRIPLYNSGITVDMIIPTGNDIQTLLVNCANADNELGTIAGAHYFHYADLVYKNHILNFIQPLIINSSYADFKKNRNLASIIKLPDLEPLIMTVADLCHRAGFEGFMVKCTRPKSDEHPDGCRHVETMTAKLSDMIITRFSAMNDSAIRFMVEASKSNTKHSLAQISKYQANLGLEGERLTFGNITFTLRVPNLTEHMAAGNKFIADILNEIAGDNTNGHLEQFGLRYIRTFLPWIASVESVGQDGLTLTTSEPDVIVRILEKLERQDDDTKLIDKLEKHVNRSQLTYVGYPVVPCTVCQYVADTPSGLYTFDPFNAFFTLAYRYLK